MRTEFISNITVDSLRYAKQLGGDVPDYDDELNNISVRRDARACLRTHTRMHFFVLCLCSYLFFFISWCYMF